MKSLGAERREQHSVGGKVFKIEETMRCFEAEAEHIHLAITMNIQ